LPNVSKTTFVQPLEIRWQGVSTQNFIHNLLKNNEQKLFKAKH